MMHKALFCVLAASLTFTTSVKSAESKWLDVSIQEIPDAVLKDAIGVASIWCLNEGMVCPGCTPEQDAWDAEAQKREKTVDRYDEKHGVFKRTTPFAVEKFVPLSHKAHEGVVRRFPATKRKDDFVEIIYDVKKNLRGWVRLTGWTSRQCQVSFQSLVEDGPIMMEVDFDSLLRGQPPRAYKSPSKTAPSVELTYDYVDAGFEAGVEVSLTELQNGFGLITAEDCEGKLSKPLGWIPLRDKQGRLIVWVCDWCSGCC